MHNLQELQGQEVAMKMLSRYLELPIPPLLIFHGPAGTGKWSAAEAFIRQKFCEIGTGCGRCIPCRKMDREDHPDYIRFPEEKVLIGDDDDPEEFTVRWLLRKRLCYTPFEAKQRFILFPRADLIQHEAETALLKTLEEPPAHSRFILLTSRLENVKSTILSRGVLIEFKRLPVDAIESLTRGQFPEWGDIMGGSLELVPFLETELFREMNLRILDALDHPLKLLDLEKWIHSGEKTAFGALTGEETFSYSAILDWFGLIFLKQTRRHEKAIDIGQSILELKEGLNREMAGMHPYFLSRFFHRLQGLLFS